MIECRCRVAALKSGNFHPPPIVFGIGTCIYCIFYNVMKNATAPIRVIFFCLPCVRPIRFKYNPTLYPIVCTDSFIRAHTVFFHSMRRQCRLLSPPVGHGRPPHMTEKDARFPIFIHCRRYRRSIVLGNGSSFSFNTGRLSVYMCMNVTF